MACTNYFQALKMATESLGKEVSRRATHNSVWLNAIPKGTYPLGTGLTQTTFAIENSMPVDDELAWEKIATTTASGNVNINGDLGLCQPSWNDVEWGFSEQTYSPERVAVRGPQVCQSNLKYRFNVDSFMRGYLEEITKHSKRILENKIQNEYMKKAAKVTIVGGADAEAIADYVVDASNEITSEGLDDTVALRPAHLDQLAIKLIEAGATEGDSNGWIEMGQNGPVFPLIIGMETSNALLKVDTDIRTDYRESSKSNELLARIGADRVSGNFRHIVVTSPARFSLNSGASAYDRVSEYEAKSLASAQGSAVQRRALYNAKTGTGCAAYEAATVLVPSVMRQLVVPPTTPGGLPFSPENYSGEWQFVTGDYKTVDGCSDPLEVFGRHYGQYEMAFEPVFGNHGATLIHLRPGAAQTG